MTVGPLVTEITGTFFVAAAILYRYGDWFRHHIIVTLSVLIAWYFSFLIIFILPLDVTSVSLLFQTTLRFTYPKYDFLNRQPTDNVSRNIQLSSQRSRFSLMILPMSAQQTSQILLSQMELMFANFPGVMSQKMYCHSCGEYFTGLLSS